MEISLILAAFFVNFGSTFARLHNHQVENRAFIKGVIDKRSVQDNVRGTYREALEQEAAKGKLAFRAMEDELWTARKRNFFERKTKFGHENFVVKKRETARRYDNAQTTASVVVKSTTTLSSEEVVKEFSKLTDSKKEAALNDLLGTCNDILKRNHDKEHEEFFNGCSANYTSKLQFLEQTYMTREYIDSHEDVEMVREIMIEEKFHQVYLSANSSYQNLVRKYKNMTDVEEQKAEKAAFENAMRPMYHESRQFKWELFVRWLLDTSFWSSESETSVRLTQLHDTLVQFVNDLGFKAEDLVRNVLTNWDDGTRDTKKWPTNDCKRAYKEFLQMRRIFETIMKLRTGKISEGDDAYGSVNENEITLASRCGDLLQNMLLTQSKIELGSGERSSTGSEDVEERYCVDAVPDVVREWNDGKSKAKGKKVGGERRNH